MVVLFGGLMKGKWFVSESFISYYQCSKNRFKLLFGPKQNTFVLKIGLDVRLINNLI